MTKCLGCQCEEGMLHHPKCEILLRKLKKMGFDSFQEYKKWEKDNPLPCYY